MQFSNTVFSTPTIDYKGDIEMVLINSKSYTLETFPTQKIGKTVVIIATVAVVLYVGVCVIGAFFTGGQSLWGLAAFAV